MPCFDGAQHWVVAADRALRRVGKALGIRAHRLSAARALLICAMIFSPGLALAPLVAQAQTTAASGVPDQSIATALPEKGDADGRRKALAARGITYSLTYVGELQSVVSGGVSSGSSYNGRLEGVLDIDLGKLAGQKGLAFHANGYQIHGNGLSGDHVGNLMTVSYTEALPTTRLSELWLEQKLLGNTLGVRFGQLAADTEFNISAYATQFINSTFGWPTIFAYDLPSGGPAYPLATPGIRFKLDPDKSTSLLLGIYNGDPAGPGAGDPQTRDRYGLNFRVQDPPLLIGEAQYRYNQDKGARGLAGTIKLGAWAHFGRFDDQRFGPDGLSLADPASNGNPARQRGDNGVYGVIDQQIWRPPTGEPDKGVGVFARASASPSDRNLIDLYFDGGIVFAGLIPGRRDDVLSFGGAYAGISSGARARDSDAIVFGTGSLVRNFEALFEVNYQIQILPGWQVDLDVQRVFSPGGNVVAPNGASGTAIPDATVLTLYTSIKY
jgi:porin